jgi:glycosyltransferase involved in cell wall biosynthesis
MRYNGFVYFCHVSNLKIGFDAKRFFKNHTGLGVYSRNVIQHFLLSYPKSDCFLLSPDINHHYLIPQNATAIIPNNSFSSIGWRSFGISHILNSLKPHIYHGLSNEIPFNINNKIKYACTIHDVIWKHRPLDHDWISRKIYDAKVTHACEKADLIVATSKQTRDDLIRFYRCKEHKIKVILQTVSHLPTSISPPLFNQPYFLYISAFYPRKNHLPLVKAYHNSVKNGNQYHLILAGRKGPTLSKIQHYISQHQLENHVTILTNINDSHKSNLLKHAKAFIYPSEIEGFGIPLAEAALSKTPLMLNNIPVFNELADNDALYFDIKHQDSLSHLLSHFDEFSAINKANKLENKLKITLSPQKLSMELMDAYSQIL